MPNLNQYNIRSSSKLAITVHDMSPAVTPEFYDLKRNLWHKFLNYKKAFDRASIIFTVSEYTKKDIVRLYGIAESKIKVAYPGIDKKIFKSEIPVKDMRRARNLYELPGDYILFLNTIEPRKNLTNLIKAFDNLDSSVDLVVAGKKGLKYRQIFGRIKQSKKSGKIRYIGYVPENDKPAIIKMAKALVYPSYYEGFGFQPLEAMALGVPVIASQVTALPEVVGNAGLLVDPYSIEGISHAMNAVLSNEQLRQDLIAKGLQRVKDFDWNITANRILTEISKIDKFTN
jgi:glycosyltransferase involved in cell wall biosynthesis